MKSSGARGGARAPAARRVAQRNLGGPLAEALRVAQHGGLQVALRLPLEEVEDAPVRVLGRAGHHQDASAVLVGFDPNRPPGLGAMLDMVVVATYRTTAPGPNRRPPEAWPLRAAIQPPCRLAKSAARAKSARWGRVRITSPVAALTRRVNRRRGGPPHGDTNTSPAWRHRHGQGQPAAPAAATGCEGRESWRECASNRRAVSLNSLNPALLARACATRHPASRRP